MNVWLCLLIPAVATLTIVFVLPVAFLAANSFFRSAGLGAVSTDFTLDNYIRFLSDPFYLEVMFETLWLGAVVVSICVVIGFPIAYLLARTSSRWRGIMIFAVVAPLLISTVVRNLGWLPILGANGLINWVLLNVGIIDQPLLIANNFTGVVIGLVHAMLPFMILSLVMVIQRIEPDLELAAVNLGAGPIRTFFLVVFPLSRAGLLAGYLLVFTITISAYTTPAMLGGKRVLVMSTFIAQQVMTVLDYAFGSAAAVLLMIVAGALTVTSLRADERAKE